MDGALQMQSISLKVQSDHCSRTTRPNSSLPIVSKFEIDLVIDQLLILCIFSFVLFFGRYDVSMVRWNFECHVNSYLTESNN